MQKSVIESNKLPPAPGPFVAAVRSNGHVFVSGQLGQDPKTGELVEGEGVEAQAKQAMIILGFVLEAAGKSFQDVVRTCIYLTDMENFNAVNADYKDLFPGGKYPARTCIAVAGLPRGAQMEIDAVVQD